MTRLAPAMILAILLGGCASTASNPQESKDRAECREYARTLEHSGRMRDACLGATTSRGWDMSAACSSGAAWTRAGTRSPAATDAAQSTGAGSGRTWPGSSSSRGATGSACTRRMSGRKSGTIENRIASSQKSSA